MSKSKAKISISVVEDDPEMRALYAGWLNDSDDFRLIGSHADGPKALAEIPNEKPDVVLMDINLPGVDGVECVKRLKILFPEIQFVMMTVFEDTNRIFNALSAGATGYLIKQTSREELLIALLEVYRGGSPMSSSIARKVVHCFRTPDKKKGENDNLAQLSAREKEVLELLSKGFLYKEISEALGISGHTVDTYLRRIYEKLHVNSRAQAAARYLEIKGSKSPGPSV